MNGILGPRIERNRRTKGRPDEEYFNNARGLQKCKFIIA